MSINKLRPLTLLVTRPAPAGERLCQTLAKLGDNAIHFPTMEIRKIDIENLIKTLTQPDWVIFISPQAVFAANEYLTTLSTAKFAAVGEGTAKQLRARGYEVVTPEQQWESEGLLAMPLFKNLTGTSIAIIQGVGGRGLLNAELAKRGAKVTTIAAYERVLPTIEIQPYLAMLTENKIDAVICASFTSVLYLKILLGHTVWNSLKLLPVIVPSMRIKKLAQELEFQTIWVAENASDEAVINLLSEKRIELCQKK